MAEKTLRDKFDDARKQIESDMSRGELGIADVLEQIEFHVQRLAVLFYVGGISQGIKIHEAIIRKVEEHCDDDNA